MMDRSADLDEPVVDVEKKGKAVAKPEVDQLRRGWAMAQQASAEAAEPDRTAVARVEDEKVLPY